MNKKNTIISGISIIVLLVLIFIFSKDEIDIKKIHSNYKYRIETGNKVFRDLKGYEKEYAELAEKETDEFKKGVYYSSLVQIYAAENKYEEMKETSQKAMEAYSKVKNGEYYQIKELEYLSWEMLSIEKFTDSFNAASDLINKINTLKSNNLTNDDIIEAESLAYSVYLCVYSEFNIMDKADFYYDKLNKLNLNDDYKVEYSKMKYFYKKENYNEAYKHAVKYNKINQSLDETFNINVSDASLLDVGLCQLEIGKLEEGKENIERAKYLNQQIGDNQSVADANVGLAIYYEKKGNKDKAVDYYKKAIEMHMKANDYYNAKKALFLLINYVESNNIEINNINIYKEYYDVATAEANTDVNSIISKIATANDELNEATLKLVNRQLNILEVVSIVGIIVIVILFVITQKLKKVIKEKQQSEKALKELVNFDYLTRVCTRSYGEELIEKRLKNNEVTISILDIDNFKRINDSLGHSVGDEILKKLGVVLKDNISDEDIIYRYGGEEFVVAFISKNKFQAKMVLDDIREKIKTKAGECNIKFTFSAGVKEIKNNDLDAAIKEADKLLYKAKNEGKNRVEI